MRGYHNNPAETAKALDDEGYLHTGDLGNLDAEGYLKIVGRKKELLKKSTGEYVPPVPIEQELGKLDIVDTAVVIADNRKFVSCLIFPDLEAVSRLKAKAGFSDLQVDGFLDSEYFRSWVQAYIVEMNKHLHHTEEVQKFAIIKTPISVEGGDLTPTMKIRRHIIEEKFKKEIDEIYRE
jgi:long-chain acyl-CoA synthetase